MGLLFVNICIRRSKGEPQNATSFHNMVIFAWRHLYILVIYILLSINIFLVQYQSIVLDI